MTKLTKQQIIILSVTILVLLFGVFYFLGPAKNKKAGVDAGPKLDQIKNFISTVNASLVKEPGELDSRVIGLAEAGWATNPFYDKKFYKDWAISKGLAKQQGEGPQLNVRYTGFVEAGKARIAIINGTEYVAGDTIGLEGYVLKEIHPTKVVIQSPTSKNRIEVPVQE